MTITVPALASLARTIEGKPILTLRNRRVFRVRVVEGNDPLEFVPDSTGEPRRPAVVELKAVLAHHDKTGSLRRADYTFSFNASYILALIKHFKDQDFSGIALSAEKVDLEYARKLKEAMKLPDAELKQRLQSSPKEPQKITVLTTAFLRSPYVQTEVLKRANGKCEACGKNAPFLRAKDGEPYLEVHHVVQLANGGEDTTENAQALCPNCHRKAHYGQPSRSRPSLLR